MEKINSIIKQKLETAELTIEPHWKRHGYIALGNKIIIHPKLSIGAKLFYTYLLMRCFRKDNCFPSYETIGKDLRVSKHTIIKFKNELIKTNLIKVYRRGWGKTNKYVLKF